VFVPTESFAAAGLALLIDIAHRTLAVGMFVLVVRLALAAFRFRRQRPDFYYGTVAAVVLVVLQAFSGMYLVASHLSFLAVMLHVACVSLLYGAIVYVGVLGLRPDAGRQADWRLRHGSAPAAAPLGGAAAEPSDRAAVAMPEAVPSVVLADAGPANYHESEA
jgi:heme A synthase